MYNTIIGKIKKEILIWRKIKEILRIHCLLQQNIPKDSTGCCCGCFALHEVLHAHEMYSTVASRSEIISYYSSISKCPFSCARCKNNFIHNGLLYHMFPACSQKSVCIFP